MQQIWCFCCFNTRLFFRQVHHYIHHFSETSLRTMKVSSLKKRLRVENGSASARAAQGWPFESRLALASQWMDPGESCTPRFHVSSIGSVYISTKYRNKYLKLRWNPFIQVYFALVYDPELFATFCWRWVTPIFLHNAGAISWLFNLKCRCRCSPGNPEGFNISSRKSHDIL